METAPEMKGGPGVARAEATGDHHHASEVSPAGVGRTISLNSATSIGGLVPDTGAAVAFLQRFAPAGPWALTAIVPDGKTFTQTFRSSTLTQMREWIDAHQGQRNIYFHVNPVTHDLNKKAEKTEIAELAWLHVDIDPRPGEDPAAEKIRALGKLREFSPAPTVIIDSGGGVQGFWRLREPVPTNGELTRCQQLEAYNIQLERLFGADACHNIDRVMRLPGTINLPNARKIKKGRKPALAKVVDFNDLDYPISMFTAAPVVGPGTEPNDGRGAVQAPAGEVYIDALEPYLGVMSEFVAYKLVITILDGLTREFPFDGDRSDAVLWACCEMIRAGVPDDTILGLLLNRRHRLSDHIYEQGGRDPAAYARRQVERASERQPEPVILESFAPIPMARHYISRARPHLRLFQSDHYDRLGSCYQVLDEKTVRFELWRHFDGAKNKDGDPFTPSQRPIANVLEAVNALVHLPSERYEIPCWIGPLAGPPVAELIVCRNGILHVPERRLLPPTPDLFCTNALTFDFEPATPEPSEWLKFLTVIFEHDPAGAEALQEMFGYLVTQRTDMQKIFWLIGPKRAGKGTIGRVLTALVGKSNSTHPSLNQLGEQFGLQACIGRQLGLIADMQLGQRSDTARIVDTLLKVSGEDSVNVQRKNRTDWEGRLNTRFVLMSNDIMPLPDASGALTGRYVIIPLVRSFYGKEDRELEGRLLRELPGILNWALAGLDRLVRNGRFTKPATAVGIEEIAADLGSPIKEFVRECCVLDPNATALKDQLYLSYLAHCRRNGVQHPPNRVHFSRGLLSATDHAVQPDKEGCEPRRPIFRGLRLASWVPVQVPDEDIPF